MSCATETTPTRGAFLLEPLKLGLHTIPAGAKLVKIGDKSVRDLSHDDARSVAMAAGAGTELVFEGGVE